MKIPDSVLQHLDYTLRQWCAGKSLEEIWRTCERGDRLLLIATTYGVNVDHKLIVRAACACARLVLHHVPKNEIRPLHAIKTAEAWARGEETIDALRPCARAHWSALRGMGLAR